MLRTGKHQWQFYFYLSSYASSQLNSLCLFIYLFLYHPQWVNVAVVFVCVLKFVEIILQYKANKMLLNQNSDHHSLCLLYHLLVICILLLSLHCKHKIEFLQVARFCPSSFYFFLFFFFYNHTQSHNSMMCSYYMMMEFGVSVIRNKQGSGADSISPLWPQEGTAGSSLSPLLY